MYQFGYCEKINTNLEVAAVFVTFCMNPAFTTMTANLVISYQHEHLELQMMRQTNNTQTCTYCLTHLPPHLCCELFKQIPQYFFDLKICRCNKQCQEKGLHVLGQVMPTYEHNNNKVVKFVCQNIPWHKVCKQVAPSHTPFCLNPYLESNFHNTHTAVLFCTAV